MALEKALLSTYSWIALPEVTSVDCFVSDDSSDVRVSFSANGRRVALVKTRVSNTTRSWGASGGEAVRMSLSVETQVAMPPYCDPAASKEELSQLLRSPWSLKMVRHKRRRSFLHRSVRGAFKVDMTRTMNEAKETQFEVELEFVSTAVSRFTEADRLSWTPGIVEFIRSAFQGQISESRFPSFEALYTTRLDERNCSNLFALKRLFLCSFANVRIDQVARMTSIDELRSVPFPGTLPKPLTRASLPAVDPRQFKVCEKTDGSRFFMLILHPCSTHVSFCQIVLVFCSLFSDSCKNFHGVFLVDRNVDFFQLDSNDSRLVKFCADFAGNGPTLLDGEIIVTPRYSAGEVLHLGFGVPSFMVFDIVACQGSNLCDEPLARREKTLLEQVSARFFELEHKWRVAAMDMMPNPFDLVYFPIFVNRKRLFPLADLAHLSRLLHREPVTGHRLYVERDGPKLKRYHLSDGLVLTHIGPYVSGGDGDLSFKWKYSELISIDFVLVRSGRRFEFYLAGNHQDLLLVRAGSRSVENEDDLKTALMQDRGADPSDPFALLDKQREPVVVELGFNPASGQWTFHCLRSKRLPNHITVGFQTMEQMMETPLELAELVQIFGKK